MTVDPKQRVLYVDDDTLLAKTFARAVTKLGMHADLAESGAEALALASRCNYPVAVTDLRMPGIDGMALIARLSAMQPTTAFVVVTADTDPALGFNGDGECAIASLLRKPWLAEELALTLERAFELHLKRVASITRSDRTSEISLLIVEDNPGDASLIEEYLSELQNVRISSVGRLGDAVRLLHEQHFDTIITDLSLPDARGLDAVLRLQTAAPGATLIVSSWLEDEALALQVVQHGAQDFLLKGSLDERSLLRALRFASERKRAERRLVQLAHFDQLTGLANRATFNARLEGAIIRARRLHVPLAVFFLDLDGFKHVNDRLGHDAGDTLLQELAGRMKKLLREYDIVARFGGDEFAVLLTDFKTTAELNQIAQRLLEAMAEPVLIGDEQVCVSASVGSSVYLAGGDSSAEILRRADQAMYAAKRAGRNQHVLSDSAVSPTQA